MSVRDPGTPSDARARWVAALRRSISAEEGLTTREALQRWRADLRSSVRAEVRRIPLAALEAWSFAGAERRLAHTSGRFFTVMGATVTIDAGRARSWTQPIVDQAEVGLLGLLVRVVDGVAHALVQAKIEPGDVRGALLAPTVQATISNYTRVHGGRQTPLLEHFLAVSRAPEERETRLRGAPLFDRLQPEQGQYFVAKRNRNAVVEVHGEVPHDDRMRWLTFGQLGSLLAEDDVVNMSLRSVLGCVPHVEAAADGAAEAWYEGLARTWRGSLVSTPLERLPGHRVEADAIVPTAGEGTSVIAVEVETNAREVGRWTQPMLTRSGIGQFVLWVRGRGPTLELLVRARVDVGAQPGVKLGPSLASEDDDADARLLAASAGRCWFDAVLSEDGGRLYGVRHRYRIAEAASGLLVDAGDGRRWLALAAVVAMCEQGRVAVELRTLLAALLLAPAARLASAG